MKFLVVPLRVVRYWFVYTIDFWKANLQIARMVLSPRIETSPETIEIETEVSKPLEILALANSITFTPGTLVTDIDPAARRLRVHVLDDGDTLRNEIREKLEIPILRITRDHD